MCQLTFLANKMAKLTIIINKFANRQLSVRMHQYIQKEVLAQNRHQTILNSESDDFLCFKSQSERVINLKRSESICENKPNVSAVQNDNANGRIVNDTCAEPNSYNFAYFNDRERLVTRSNDSSRNEPNIHLHNNHLSDLKSAYGEQPNFKLLNQDNNREIIRVNSETSPLLIQDQSKSITLIKNSASLIFTKKDNNPVVHRRRDDKSTTSRDQYRRSLPNSVNGNLDSRQQTFSWYAPVYSALTEESDQNSRESSPYHNLAYAKKQTNGLRESTSLLETNHQLQPQIHQTRVRKIGAIRPPSLNIQQEGPQIQLTSGGPAPKCSTEPYLKEKRNRFEQLIKTLVGRKVSREPITPPLLPSPEIRITRSPSEHNLIKSDKLTSSTSSLNSVQQKLWSVVPLLRRNDSCISLHQAKSSPVAHHSGLKKCQTVLALTRSSSNLEPIKPQNRLRHSTSTCSRCSSLLSLAANGSRYSLNLSHGAFVAVGCNDKMATNAMPSAQSIAAPVATFVCKLCLGDFVSEKSTRIKQCGCLYCSECMVAYVEFEIMEGAYEISCPDALCPAQGILSLDEITKLSSSSLIDKHNRYRLNREVELDKNRTWCPRAGCETWHQTLSCDENIRRLAAIGEDDTIGIPFDSDLIKCCPMCSVPIEKDEGCAQMMCKRCKHVFCWYCLASLDDDFLLRHYDKGPCKNKLGHSQFHSSFS
ncbi:putative E3 ubiquitin-protein ligase, partial [Pseudolycoriella hygida]